MDQIPGDSKCRGRHTWIVAFAALLITMSTGASTVGVDTADEHRWPGFRGALRDGVSAETGIVDSWPETGPSILWRRGIGAGFSGVAVGGGRAFTLEQDAGEQRLVALDAGSGATLWKTTTGPGFTSEYGDGPRATPVLEDDRVYVVDANARLGAMDVETGRVIWGYDLPESFAARVPAIGFSSTPVIEGDHLIVEVGADDGAFMAFHKTTGERVWSSQSDEAAYVAPIVVDALGRRQVVFFSGSGLYALAPASGSLLWHAPWKSPCPATGIPLNAASPVFLPPDRIFASAAWGDRKGGAVFRISEGENGLAVEEVWHDAATIDGEIGTAVRLGGHLYGFKGSIFLSVDAATGETAWSARGFGRGSLIAADGKLIVLGERGRLALVEATPAEYRELATTQLLDGRSWTSPSLAGRRLFVRNETEILSVDLAEPPARHRAR